MTFLKKAVRAVTVVLALAAGSMHAKPAQADGGAVIAGIAGGLILGSIIGSSANANNGYYAPSAPVYHAPRQTYYAPAPVYAPAPIYYPRAYSGPNVSFTFGTTYYGGKRHHGKRHYNKRHYGGHRRGHGARHYRGHRGHGGHRRGGYRRHH